MQRRAAAPPSVIGFRVLDVLGGLCQLVRRSPTLRGSVPLRVAQACVPLCEGNAFGHTVTLRERLPIRRSLGGWELALPEPERLRLERRLHDGLALLQSSGWLAEGSPWRRELQRGILAPIGPLRRSLRLWTGLLVAPEPDVFLHVLPAGNRGPLDLEVAEYSIADADRLVPLVLELSPEGAGPAQRTLHGELACLAPFSPHAELSVGEIEEAPEILRAHCGFFDASYFARKSGGPTRRYRKTIATGPDPSAAAATRFRCRALRLDDTPLTVEHSRRYLGADEPQPQSPAGRRGQLSYFTFANLLEFTARYDGAAVELRYDAEALGRRARVLRQRARALLGDGFVEEHRGALLYLSRYFTAHPPGEPHFFVKPWALFDSSPGVSSLVEGGRGDGYQILRGVVATDQFHATPAVFHIHHAKAELGVPERAPLARVFPVPRRLQHAGFRPLCVRDGVVS